MKEVKINCFFKQRLNSVNILFHLSDRSKELQSLTFLKQIVLCLVVDLNREIKGIWAFLVDRLVTMAYNGKEN